MAKTKTTEEIVREIIERGAITEREIKLLQKRANAGGELPDTWDHEITLADVEQSQKGIEWLRKQQRRRQSPFGYREDAAIDHFTHFTFDGFIDAGNVHRSWYVPLYTVHGLIPREENQHHDHEQSVGFQYYVAAGEPVIIG